MFSASDCENSGVWTGHSEGHIYLIVPFTLKFSSPKHQWKAFL